MVTFFSCPKVWHEWHSFTLQSWHKCRIRLYLNFFLCPPTRIYEHDSPRLFNISALGKFFFLSFCTPYLLNTCYLYVGNYCIEKSTVIHSQCFFSVSESLNANHYFLMPFFLVMKFLIWNWKNFTLFQFFYMLISSLIIIKIIHFISDKFFILISQCYPSQRML